MKYHTLVASKPHVSWVKHLFVDQVGEVHIPTRQAVAEMLQVPLADVQVTLTLVKGQLHVLYGKPSWSIGIPLFDSHNWVVCHPLKSSTNVEHC